MNQWINIQIILKYIMYIKLSNVYIILRIIILTFIGRNSLSHIKTFSLIILSFTNELKPEHEKL